MGYIERSLADGERVVYEAHFHWLEYASAWIPAVAGVVLAFLFWVVWPVTIWWLPFLFLCVGALGTLIGLIPLRATEMAVTNQRIIYKRGFLRRATEELGLRTIEEVNLVETVLGHLLGYGRIYAKGTGGGEIFFPFLNDPVEFRSAIEDARREAIFLNPTETLRSGGGGSG